MKKFIIFVVTFAIIEGAIACLDSIQETISENKKNGKTLTGKNRRRTIVRNTIWGEKVIIIGTKDYKVA